MKQLWSVKLVMKTGKNMQIIVVRLAMNLYWQKKYETFLAIFNLFVLELMLNDLSTIDD